MDSGLTTGGAADGADEVGSIDVDALYRAHRRRLIGLVAAITLDRQIAEEVVHDAFVGLQRAVDDVRSPEAYLRRSVVNGAISRIRRRERLRFVPMPTIEVTTGDAEIDEMWELVARLPSRQRAVVVLRFWEDLPVDAIAATLGWPDGSVKSTLHRALARLREELT